MHQVALNIGASCARRSCPLTLAWVLPAPPGHDSTGPVRSPAHRPPLVDRPMGARLGRGTGPADRSDVRTAVRPLQEPAQPARTGPAHPCQRRFPVWFAFARSVVGMSRSRSAGGQSGAPRKRHSLAVLQLRAVAAIRLARRLLRDHEAAHTRLNQAHRDTTNREDFADFGLTPDVAPDVSRFRRRVTYGQIWDAADTKHLALVAINHVQRAVELVNTESKGASGRSLPRCPIQAGHLRNVEEHWDEYADPQGKTPGSVTLGSGVTASIGGADVPTLLTWLDAAEAWVRSMGSVPRASEVPRRPRT
jgi:hypothetical protein